MDMGLVLAALFMAFAALCAYALLGSWRRTSARQRLTAIVFILTVICAATDSAFESWSQAQLGGMAQWGKTTNGHYFVGNHGHYAEVSESAFRSNLFYGELLSDLQDASFVLLLILLLWIGWFRQPSSRRSFTSILESGKTPGVSSGAAGLSAPSATPTPTASASPAPPRPIDDHDLERH